MGILNTISSVFKGCRYFDHSGARVTPASTALMRAELTDLLTRLIKLFGDHNIRYAIIDGTLLGALRGSDFIPWDDDMDLSIHPADWARLEKILPKTQWMTSSRSYWDDGFNLAADRDRSQEYIYQLCLPSAAAVHADIVRADFEYYKPLNGRIIWQNTDNFFDPPMHVYQLGDVPCMGPKLATARRYLASHYGNTYMRGNCGNDGLSDFNVAVMVFVGIALLGARVWRRSRQALLPLVGGLCVVTAWANWINIA